MTGREGEAVARYEEALRAGPENPEAAANLGRLLAGSGRFEEALPLLRLGAAGLPETNIPRIWLALSLVETGRAGEAEGVLYEAAAIGADPRILLLRARIRFLRGDRTGAVATLDQARSAGLPPEPALRRFLGEEDLIGRALAP
jgi:Flp pilus assembly protein TadD